MKDQSVIKIKFDQKGIRPSGSLILGGSSHVKKKRGEEKK